MSIADKLVTVAENVEKVYNAGFEKGKSEGGGLPKEYEWVKYATRSTLNIKDFEGETLIFTSEKFLGTDGVYTLFTTPSMAKPNIKRIVLNFTSVNSLYRLFFNLTEAQVPNLERITINSDTSKCTNYAQFVRSHSVNLTTIDGTPLDFSSATTIEVFCNRCFQLSYIRIVPNTIKVNADFSGSYSWDDESLQSIVDGLATVTETQILTLHSDVADKLTETQWTQIYNKNWQVG